MLALHVDGVPLSVYFKSHGEHMTLHTDHEGTPDATLSGTPLSLLRLAGPAPEAALRGGAVHIEGDAEVAQTFSELLKAAQPDLEEELSRVVGDVAAHQSRQRRTHSARLRAPRAKTRCCRTWRNICRKKAATCRIAPRPMNSCRASTACATMSTGSKRG